MKNIINILLFQPVLIFSQGQLVGINTDKPSALLDIVSKNNTSSTKALEINNSASTEMFTILNNGNTGIHVQNPVAQLEVSSPAPTKSVMKIAPVSSTNAKQASSINYNSLRNLVTDNNGNIFEQYNPSLSNSTAIIFDGSYTSETFNKTLCTVNNGSIIRFILHTSFLYGQTDVGAIIYADITWSKDIGFKVTRKAYNISRNANPMVITGEGTNLLTFDFAIGDDLIFEVIGGNLVYRGSESTNSFRIHKSFRSR